MLPMIILTCKCGIRGHSTVDFVEFIISKLFSFLMECNEKKVLPYLRVMSLRVSKYRCVDFPRMTPIEVFGSVRVVVANDWQIRISQYSLKLILVFLPLFSFYRKHSFYTFYILFLICRTYFYYFQCIWLHIPLKESALEFALCIPYLVYIPW